MQIQNHLEYFCLKVFCLFIRLAPLRLALWIGKALGVFAFSFLRIRKTVAIDNISSSFPEKSFPEVIKIASNTYKIFGQNIIEFIRLPQMNHEYLEQKVTFVNESLLQQAFLTGKGTLCVSGHFGNWEIIAAAISAKGYPMIAVARDQRNPFANRMINEHRRAAGIETLQLGFALRGVLKSLRENKFVALLGDQDAHDEGTFIDFLGRPSSTAPGIAQFALKTKAPIVFGAAVRGKNGHHTVYLRNIDHHDLEGITEENVKILTQRHARALEEFVREWPDHWFWLHKRWKTHAKARKQSDQHVV